MGIFNRLFPVKRWPDGRPMTAADESAHWILTCRSCGADRSYADIGGTRFRARGERKVVRIRCGPCGKATISRVSWRPPGAVDTT